MKIATVYCASEAKLGTLLFFLNIVSISQKNKISNFLRDFTEHYKETLIKNYYCCKIIRPYQQFRKREELRKNKFTNNFIIFFKAAIKFLK